MYAHAVMARASAGCCVPGVVLRAACRVLCCVPGVALRAGTPHWEHYD
jgi:hypothetical protein